MAVALGKSPSGVSRELAKARAKGSHRISRYSWRKAKRVTSERRTLANQQHQKLGFDADLTAHVRKRLALDWVPEQVVVVPGESGLQAEAEAWKVVPGLLPVLVEELLLERPVEPSTPSGTGAGPVSEVGDLGGVAGGRVKLGAVVRLVPPHVGGGSGPEPRPEVCPVSAQSGRGM